MCVQLLQVVYGFKSHITAALVERDVFTSQLREAEQRMLETNHDSAGLHVDLYIVPQVFVFLCVCFKPIMR